ncbi:MAG: exo-alpha-sialidase, partial [Candidatus Poribacteria bacterium]|nr:exo-alpha-sialidase [Candidatus Poribacteria bacterium]
MSSSDTLLLATRKGLIALKKNGSGWNVAGESFIGQTLSYAVHDRRTGTLWAALDHGHWGVKLQRSNDFGENWEEVDVPKYPEGAVINKGHFDENFEFQGAPAPATLLYLWVLQPGHDSTPNRLYAG